MCISIHTLDLVMVEAPLIAITALFFLGNDATGLANLNMEYFSHSSLQILKSSVRLDGSVAAQIFSAPSIDSQWDSSLGSGWVTH